MLRFLGVFIKGVSRDCVGMGSSEYRFLLGGRFLWLLVLFVEG